MVRTHMKVEKCGIDLIYAKDDGSRVMKRLHYFCTGSYFHEQSWWGLGFAVKLMALIPYYEIGLIIIERVEVYKYTNTRAKR